MQILGLLSCVMMILAAGIIHALPYPYPAREIRSPAIAASVQGLPPIVRRARGAEELKKDDLEGSESAYVTYPYLGLPYHGYGYYAPHVVYVG